MQQFIMCAIYLKKKQKIIKKMKSYKYKIIYVILYRMWVLVKIWEKQKILN